MSKIRGLSLVATLSLSLVAAGAHAQLSCGPVILAGHDADDHGFHALYAGLFNELEANLSNGGSGILALGADPGSASGLWINQVAILMTNPQAVTFVNDMAISSQSFAGFGILFVPSDSGDVGGGITQSENDRLQARSSDIAAFVNDGGGLFGLTQGQLINAWAYVSDVVPLEDLDAPPSGTLPSGSNFDDISATAEGMTLGISNTNLDGCCFHNVFTKLPPFLDVLAVANEPADPDYDDEPVFIGGRGTCLLPFCGDGVLDPGEECDDGNNIDGDGCSAACRIETGANRPPVLACAGCEICTSPGLCAADIACDVDRSLCLDPDLDPVNTTCGPSGPYPLGVNVIDYTCSDGALSTSATCSITVRDCEPPTCTPPAPEAMECNSQGGVLASDPAVQAWLAAANGVDNCAVAALTNAAPALFPASCPGLATPVSFTATDDAGYEGSCIGTLTVADTQPPALVVPPPLVVECDGCDGGVGVGHPDIQAWLATMAGSDVCSAVTLNHDAPGFFPASCGVPVPTIVTFTATDACGLTTVLQSSVAVVDTRPPILTVPPPIVVECSEVGGSGIGHPEIRAWLASAEASDDCGDAEVSNDAPALFGSGCVPGATTTVTFTAVDDCGLETTGTSEVTVVDTTPPEVTACTPQLCLWPPNHGYVCFSDASAMITARDTCDPDAGIIALECESSQCDDAPCAAHPGENGDGHTTDDCVWDPATDTLCVRAERAGTQPEGRFYSVKAVVADNCGNEARAVGLEFYVPHDQSPHEGCISPPPAAPKDLSKGK